IRYRRVAEGPTPDDVPSPAFESAPEFLDRAPVAEPPPADEPPLQDAPTEPEHSGDDDEVPWEGIVRGYELEPGRVVTVDAGELESVAPERTRVLEVEQFVDLRDIDPVHFDKSYYVVPQRDTATERPYRLLHRAMEEAGKVAIGRFVMRTKEYLVAVRPAEHVLMLETLFYADEVRDPKEVWAASMQEPSERELQVAGQFLEALSGNWEPARHRDEHRERLLDLLHSKAGDAIVIPETDEESAVSPAIDLMEALEASVEAARRARAGEGEQAG
ncbi:MAG: Ku protein, partial [Actinomycetota bacterium]